ncbi:hypothetical protein KBY82_02810 [Cyanobium sp. AMD-g]|uniref:hypothetical protein n=1 Tax=Cyanobium sp. AMD-g TaxID=2823699 RepID=UPI0020CDCDE3|nr:hypothetical protein [Cyanobium sp. AMD-g]MCP9929710.1 hypothetical protein [Cyanobium sp. AMD-g]
MVPLAYQPGNIGFCDITKVKRVAITLRGEPFQPLLFHDRLAWSGGCYGRVIHGSESYLALSEGLQNALAACGGAPRDRAHCAHFRLSPSRNNLVAINTDESQPPPSSVAVLR